MSTLVHPVGERDHARGPEDAPTMVVYGDYECPYTRALNLEVGRIRRRRPDALRFVYRHFPLRQIHPRAREAAEAAEAAAAQGGFWEMHDRLFHGHEPLTRERILRDAAGLGLDADRIRRELDAETHVRRVDEDLWSGLESGVEGTPGVFVHGRRYRGPHDPESLLAALSAVAVEG